MEWLLQTVELRREQDVVLARQRARQIAELLRFEHQDQVRIATAVSEIARNAFMYAGRGQVRFELAAVEGGGAFRMTIRDTGPGISNLSEIQEGRYKSKTGMGRGITGADRLMDSFEITSSRKDGTCVVMEKTLPREAGPVTESSARNIHDALGQTKSGDPFTELQEQNREILGTLQELQKRQEELAQLNHELEDTNRGVVALYAELDEKADHLRRASDIKSQFLSNMTHEFRTPVNSILTLSRLLLDRVDGDLTPDQEKQARFIQKAAHDLSDLVNDLLDLAKVEAGKVTIRPALFSATDLFGALRGMLRPLAAHNSAIQLVFEDPAEFPVLETDESKLSQVLRNFISNSLKYTERGEIRVSVTRADKWQEPEGLRLCTDNYEVIPRRSDWAVFAVTDTGVGITAPNIPRIFEEFAQVDGPHQKAKGTGLGLPLSRRLAELLGGGVAVASKPGVGSTFCAFLPTVYRGALEPNYVPSTTGRTTVATVPEETGGPDDRGALLIVDDDETARYVLRGLLAGLPYRMIECANPVEGLIVAREQKLAAIFLDLAMPEMSGFTFLKQLNANGDPNVAPVIVHTAKPLSDVERGILEAQTVGIVSKDHRDRERSAAEIRMLLTRAGVAVS